MELTRLEAAERQLRQAIRLFFGGGDEVSVHTLTGAACRVLRDLAKHQRGSHPLQDVVPHIRPEKRQEFFKLLTVNQNFFKHAGNGPESSLTFNPESTEFLLFDATMTHISLTGCALPETLIFALWFVLRHDDIVASDGPLKDLVGKLDVPSAVADRATARAAIETARTQYGEHIPLPAFGTAAPPKA